MTLFVTFWDSMFASFGRMRWVFPALLVTALALVKGEGMPMEPAERILWRVEEDERPNHDVTSWGLGHGGIDNDARVIKALSDSAKAKIDP